MQGVAEVVMKKTLFAGMMLLGWCVGLAAQDQGLSERIDRYLQPLLEEDLISGALLIARGDQILVQKAFGLANREYQQPCGLDTRFRLASVSKMFTAAAILLLQQDGKLSVNNPLSTYLPDYPNGDTITLHHLLNHTSGVVNYSGLEDHYRVWAMPHTREQVMARFRDKPLQFEPGTQWRYSNSGYVLLAAVIEKVGGRPYGVFLQERIFGPLGMAATQVDDPLSIIPLRATGHYNQGGRLVQAPYLDMSFPTGAGSLLSTVGDLFTWHRALMGERLLNKSSKEEMFRPGLGDYGYGWFIRRVGNKTLMEHPGGINGFLSSIKYLVEDDLLVVTLFNYVSTFARRVNEDLMSLAMGREVGQVLNRQGVTLTEDTLRACAGVYAIEGGGELKVEVREGKLWMLAPGEAPEWAIAQTPRAFFLRRSNAIVQFVTLPGDKPGLLLMQSENVIPCPRTREP